jgi:hypothetical protein
VRALALDSNFRVYAGGIFDHVGAEPRAQVARWSSGGFLDDWAPITGMLVSAIALDFSSIYLGGEFQLRKFSTTSGLPDEDWNPAVLGSIYALALDADGLLVGGNFDQIGGETRHGLARIGAAGSGTVDPDWNPSSDAEAEIGALLLDGNGALYAGGRFAAMSGEPHPNLGRLVAASGAAVAGWNPSPDGEVRALALDADGSLLVGGKFTSIGGEVREAVAALPAADGALTILPPTLPGAVIDEPYGAAVTAAGGSPPYTFELVGLLPDGLTLDPATGAITGTPVSAGPFFFGIAAVDGTPPEAGGPFSGGRAYEVWAKSAQTIAFEPHPGHLVYGGAATQASARASSFNAIEFGTDTEAVCTVSALDVGVAEVVPLAAGECIVVANQGGNDLYWPAPEQTLVIVVDRAEQAPFAVSASPANVAVGGPSTLAASGGSGTGAVTYAITAGSDRCELSDARTLVGRAVGRCTVTATKAADANHEPASATTDVEVTSEVAGPLLRDGFEDS